MKPLIIIGTGLAGYTLAREWRKREEHQPLIMISSDHGGFYSKPMLSNALAQDKTADQLLLKPAEQMAGELSASILAHTTINEIDTNARKVVSGSGEFEYENLVLATGANPIHIPIAGNAANDIISVNNLDDYRHFRQQLAGKNHVVLMGAGLIGCEFANDLAASGFEVTVLDPASWPLGQLLPEVAGMAMRDALTSLGTDMKLGTTLEQMDASDSGYTLKLSDDSTIEADLILSAVGLRPDLTLASKAGLRTDRGIITDQYLRTSDAHIYALGDAAEVNGQVLPFIMPIMHEARSLAATLAGEPTELTYPVMPVGVKTPILPTVLAPPPPGSDGDWVIESEGQNVLARFESTDGQLLGFALTGDATKQKQSLAAEMGPT